MVLRGDIMKRKTIIVFVIVILMLNSVASLAVNSKDRPSWFAEYVDKLQQRNILSVLDKNEFDPDKIVTRQDIIRMIVISQDYKDSLGNLSNIPYRANNSYIYLTNRAVEMGIVESHQVLSIFNPYDFISREEAVELFIKKLDLFSDTVHQDTPRTTFKDSYDVSLHRVPYFNRAISIGMVKGYSDNTFRPKNYITMSEAAAMIWRIIENIEKNYFQSENSLFLKYDNNHINIVLGDSEKTLASKLNNPVFEHVNNGVTWRAYLLKDIDFVLIAIEEGVLKYIYSNSRNWQDSSGIYGTMELSNSSMLGNNKVQDNLISLNKGDVEIRYYIDSQHVPKVNSVELYDKDFYKGFAYKEEINGFKYLLEDLTFILINSFRFREGLEELKRNLDIDEIAYGYTEILGEQPHMSFLWELQGGAAHALSQGGISYWGVAENTRVGKYLPVETVEFWISNLEDRNLILNRTFTQGGVGVYIDDNGIMYYSLIHVMPPIQH